VEWPTQSTGWTAPVLVQGKKKSVKRLNQFVKIAPKAATISDTDVGGGDIVVNPAVLERSLRLACKNAIDSEPKLTEWDTVMGDGDCGETVKRGCLALVSSLDSGLASKGSVIAVLKRVSDIVEHTMGGTLGGIFGIFFAKLLGEVRKGAAAVPVSSPSSNLKIFSTALTSAINSLSIYTPAKVGDRTIMDVLIPFVQALAETQDLNKAKQVAIDRAEGTKKLNPKLGRASYTASSGAGDEVFPPDPGAWAVMELICGLIDGINGK